MFVPEAHTFSKHFTHLVGRDVKFAKAGLAPDSASRWVYGSYQIIPADDPSARKPLVVKADLDLLGSLAGSLVGLPSDDVVRRLKSPKLDELMHDAINEILNVASGAIAAGARAIFVEMSLRADEVKGDAAQVLATPSSKGAFDVSVQGYNGGRFIVHC